MNDFPSTVQLLVAQTRYQLLTFWRIPVAMFFTLGLPLIMLVLFNALFGNSTIVTPEGSWSSRQFYTGGLAAFTAASATFTNLANMVPIRRDEGVLKRWRGTPLPTWIYIAGFICSAIVIAFVGVTIMLDVRRRGVRPRDRSGEDAGGLRDVPRRGRIVRCARYGARVAREVGDARRRRRRTRSSCRWHSCRTSSSSSTTRRGGSRSSATSFRSSRSPRRSRPASPRSSRHRRSSGTSWRSSPRGVSSVLFVALRKFSWEPSGSAPRARRRRAATTT